MGVIQKKNSQLSVMNLVHLSMINCGYPVHTGTFIYLKKKTLVKNISHQSFFFSLNYVRRLANRLISFASYTLLFLRDLLSRLYFSWKKRSSSLIHDEVSWGSGNLMSEGNGKKCCKSESNSWWPSELKIFDIYCTK